MRKRREQPRRVAGKLPSRRELSSRPAGDFFVPEGSAIVPRSGVETGIALNVWRRLVVWGTMGRAKHVAAFAAAIGMGCALSGCASVTEGSTQSIAVTTTPVSGASCVLSNTRGKWTVVTPGTAIVEKSVTTLKAVCSKEGWQDAKAYLTPGVPVAAEIGMMLPYVGILSAAVDGSTGAANKYPGAVLITMKPPTAGTPSQANATTTPAAAQK